MSQSKTVKRHDFSQFCNICFNNDLSGVQWDNNIFINGQNYVNKMFSRLGFIINSTKLSIKN